MPRDIAQAALAFMAAILLGLGFGMLNGVIALAIPMWFTGYVLLTIVLWITAGVVFVPDALPVAFRRPTPSQLDGRLEVSQVPGPAQGPWSTILERLAVG